MKPIETEELSAYADGELDAARARVIEAALADDTTLRRKYQEILEADLAWRTAARSAQFQPHVRLHHGVFFRSGASVCAALFLLMLIRVLPKVGDALLWGLLLQTASLVAMMAWVIRISRAALPVNVR